MREVHVPTPFPNLPPVQRGRVHHVWLHGEALTGNPWDDPTHRDLHVYTPPGYDADDARHPVVMLLPGFAGTGEALLARGLTDIPISSRIDRLIDDGCPPFIAVLPDVMTRVGGSQYVDSPGIGAYLSYLVDDVMPAVDADFRTTGAWGAAGRSSGGLGAFNLAVRAPDRVRAIAFHAGDAGFDLGYLGDIPKAIRGLERVGGLDGLLDAFWSHHRPPPDLFAALNIVAMSCAYSPDPAAAPFPARLPFDPATGAIDFDVLASWRVHDPVVRARDPQVQATLSRLALLFVDAGRHDEYHLHLGARRLVAALRAGGVEVDHEEFDGGHRGTAWRYDVSLPKLAAALTGA